MKFKNVFLLNYYYYYYFFFFLKFVTKYVTTSFCGSIFQIKKENLKICLIHRKFVVVVVLCLKKLKIRNLKRARRVFFVN